MHRISLTYTKRIKLRDLLNMLVVIFLFLTFLNYITRNYYWMFMAFALFLITPKRVIVWNSSTLSLFVLGLTMLTFGMGSIGTITGFLKPFVFFMAYVLGSGMTPKSADHQQKMQFITNTIYLCTLGFFAHYVLNFLTNLGSLERNTIDIWTKSVLSATGQASLATMGCAVIGSILFSERSVRQKVVAVVFAILIVSYNLILAGRTLLYMLALSILIAYLYTSVARKKNIINILLTVGIIAALIVFAYNMNMFNIRTMIETSNLYQRMLSKNGLGIAGDLRFDYKLFYLKRLLDYPFGGNHIRAECLHYAHDLYLDSYDEYGVVALVAIVFYILSSLIRLAKFLRNPNAHFHVKLLVLCTSALLNIQFWLEPIMDGMPFLFVAYCMVDGALSRYLISQSRNKPSE